MRFASRLSISITILLTISLSIGGFLFVRQNFRDSLDAAVEYNAGRHLMEKYSLESELMNMAAMEQDAKNRQLARYGKLLTEYLGKGQRWIAFYDENRKEIFSTFEAQMKNEEITQALDAEHYYIRRAGKEAVILMASPVESKGETIWLLTGYSASSLFAERGRQLDTFIKMELAILAGAVVVVVFVSSSLTRPIRKLNILSRKIAAGAYTVRTSVKSRDEIGQLSENFDKMAIAVEQKVEDLNTSLRLRDEFVAAFTHEIKTPMTSIIGYSDILRSAEQEPEVRQKAANYIYIEAKRLEALSQKLLLLMGLSDNERLIPKPVQLNTLFAIVGRTLLTMLEEIKLDFKPGGALYVMAEYDLAADMLRNLILNAAKAKPKDGTVHVYWATEGEQVRIFVEDNGCGITPDQLMRIKEPFYMVDKSRARAEGGSGLGLALCEKIAVLHGGTLRFESQLGKGTIVSFTLEKWEGTHEE